MNNTLKEWLLPTGKSLLDITATCHDSMHEPNVSAVVKGNHLDNAMGNHPDYNCGEFIVGLTSEDEKTTEWFNLSDLIALAKFGAKMLIAS